MDRNFPRALSLVLKYEGGFVNDPHDPGGATNKGITLSTFRLFIKRNGTVDDLKAISDADVAKVYRRHYWDQIHGDDLPDGVDFATFDFAVNSGVGRAARYLQNVVSAEADGKIGPATIAAVRAKHNAYVIDGLCAKRLMFLENLPTWGHFGKGWAARVASVRLEANKMAATAAMGKTPVQAAPEPVQRVAPVPALVEPPKPPLVLAPAPVAGQGFWAAIFAMLFNRKG